MKNVVVIGAGTMGNGIAHVFAQQGFNTVLVALNNAVLASALATIGRNLDRQVAKGTLSLHQKAETLTRLTCSTHLSQAVGNAQLVVEAVTESEALKLKIFAEVDAAAPADCILATNTSSISITKIAAATQRQGQVIGMHFMNPVPVMKLVEIINGYGTLPSTTDAVVAIANQLGKTPCVAADYPGFVANRILMPMINEAIATLHEGVAGVQAIDAIMKLGMAHPMGPLQLADFIGLDVCHAILQVLHSGFGNPKYAPCILLTNMVAAGKLGVKSGEGFYRYEKGGTITEVAGRFR
jgi:3-hydroxybutyryl-CoA dehydrogenase